MPRSRIRRRNPFTPPPEKTRSVRLESPRWFAPVMIAFMVVGLIWVVVYYVSQTEYPIADIGNYNMAIGFGLIAIGFILATRWK